MNIFCFLCLRVVEEVVLQNYPMLKADFKKHIFLFKTPGGTSRGVLHTKDSWYISLWDDEKPALKGVGECSIIKGLSYDDRPDYEKKLQSLVDEINETGEVLFVGLDEYPSIYFGLETAMMDFHSGGTKELFPSEFTEGEDSISINGLIWMGTPEFMWQQIEDKIASGFNCIKLKIGAVDFESELNILKKIRKRYGEKVIELRVDANGAFNSDDVWYKLDELAKLKIHSIEQPVKAGNYELMQEICRNSPLPIALDEELTGVIDEEKKAELIEFIKPQYIILKPSLLGGIEMSEEWIEIAEENDAGWWVTSALEGNIGLNAIAQWTYTLNNPLPQGLGTGQVFANNIGSPMRIQKGRLHYVLGIEWENPFDKEF